MFAPSPPSSPRACLRVLGAVLAGLGALVLLPGCPAAPPKPTNTAAIQRNELTTNRIEASAWFDVATCWPSPSKSSVINQSTLLGAAVQARPLVLECLVDAASRGPSPHTAVTVDLTVPPTGELEVKVQGDNLTPASTTCVRDAVAKFVANLPRPTGAAVTARTSFEHDTKTFPSVKLGASDSQDIYGRVRLALPGMCSCFEGWKAVPPRSIKAAFTVAKPAPGASVVPEIALDPTGDAPSDAAATCLAEKLKTEVKWTAPGLPRLRVEAPLHFINTAIDEPEAGAKADLVIAHYDQSRLRGIAQTAIRAGERQAAAEKYNDLVTRFRAGGKGAPTFDQLSKGCEALIAADDVWITAMERSAAAETRMKEFSAQLATKEKGWEQLRDVMVNKQAEAEKELGAARTARTNDSNACPKIRKK